MNIDEDTSWTIWLLRRPELWGAAFAATVACLLLWNLVS
jgi:hypothetical protein